MAGPVGKNGRIAAIAVGAVIVVACGTFATVKLLTRSDADNGAERGTARERAAPADEAEDPALPPVADERRGAVEEESRNPLERLTEVVNRAARADTARSAKIELAEHGVRPNGAIATALLMFYHDLDRYPTTEEGLDALFEPPADESEAGHWVGPYIMPGSDLKDPWGTPYQYACPGEHNIDGYDLSSAGPDRTFGNEDDSGNWLP